MSFLQPTCRQKGGGWGGRRKGLQQKSTTRKEVKEMQKWLCNYPDCFSKMALCSQYHSCISFFLNFKPESQRTWWFPCRYLFFFTYKQKRPEKGRHHIKMKNQMQKRQPRSVSPMGSMLPSADMNEWCQLLSTEDNCGQGGWL